MKVLGKKTLLVAIAVASLSGGFVASANAMSRNSDACSPNAGPAQYNACVSTRDGGIGGG